jgi:hypothetical protein
MNIKNLKVTNKIKILGLTTTISVITLSGCNRQIADFNKEFNVVVEKNNETIQTIGIKKYSDYEGSQVQFITEDGLIVLSSTYQTQLLRVTNNELLEKYISSLECPNCITISYDELQNTEIDYDLDNWNKKLIDTNYTFDKAIILSDDTATIFEIKKWRDYNDDKIQIKLEDGTCILTNSEKIKLLNDKEANKDSVKNYAISLVGNEENVKYYNQVKTKTK